MKNFPKTLVGFYWAMFKKRKAYMLILSVIGVALGAWEVISWSLASKYSFAIFESGVADFWAHALRMLLIVFIIYFIDAPFAVASNILKDKRWPKILHEIREELYKYIHGNDYKFFLDKNVGKIQAQVGLIMNGFFNLTTVPIEKFGGTVVGLIAIGGIMMSVDWRVALLTIGWGFVRLIWILLFSKKYARLSSEASKAESGLGGTISDSVLNYANVKIFATEKTEREHIDKEQKVILIKKWARDKYRIIHDQARGNVHMLVMVAVIALCAKLFYEGAISMPEAAFMITATGGVSWNISRLGDIYKEAARDYADAKQAWDEVIVPHTIVDKFGARPLVVKKGEVDLRGIYFKYNKDWVVDGLSMKIKPGEKVGVVGLSGAGKTTVSNLLLRLFDVQKGGIYIDGQNIKNVTQDSLRRQVAFVSQDPALFNRTLAENIGYAKPEATRDEIVRAAKLANIHDFIMSASKEYDTIVGNRGVKLSGGERQRVAIARAILKDSPILILDEATSALDSETEAAIQKSFDSLMKGRTAVVIAHRLSTLRKMDRIVVMDKGKIVEAGKHDALLKKGGVYARLWKMQSGGFI